MARKTDAIFLWPTLKRELGLLFGLADRFAAGEAERKRPTDVVQPRGGARSGGRDDAGPGHVALPHQHDDAAAGAGDAHRTLRPLVPDRRHGRRLLRRRRQQQRQQQRVRRRPIHPS